MGIAYPEVWWDRYGKRDKLNKIKEMIDAINNSVKKSGDTMTGTLNAQDILPNADNTYDLGSSSYRWKELFIDTVELDALKSGKGYLLNNTIPAPDLTPLHGFQGNMLSFKQPYKVEYWNTSTNEWVDITTDYTWGYTTDMRTSTQIVLGAIQSETIRIRFYFNMGSRWVSYPYALQIIMQHGQYIDSVKVESADDSDITTNVETCLNITSTITTGTDFSIVFPLQSLCSRRYVRIDVQFRSAIYPTHMNLKQLLMPSFGSWSGKGLMDSLLPFDWDYNRNVTFSGTITANGSLPISAGNTSLCTNLNADLLDGYHASNLPLSGTVTQSKLKTTTGSVSTNVDAGELLTLPGGQYAFFPQGKQYPSATAFGWWGVQTARTIPTSYATIVICDPKDGDYTFYILTRYVQSSPEEYFYYGILDKTKNEIVSQYIAEAHPCYGNGGDLKLMPHPFPEYFSGYDTSRYEIVFCHLTESEYDELKYYVKRERDKCPLTAFQRHYTLGSLREWKPREIMVDVDLDTEAEMYQTLKVLPSGVRLRNAVLRDTPLTDDELFPPITEEEKIRGEMEGIAEQLLHHKLTLKAISELEAEGIDYEWKKKRIFREMSEMKKRYRELSEQLSNLKLI